MSSSRSRTPTQATPTGSPLGRLAPAQARLRVDGHRGWLAADDQRRSASRQPGPHGGHGRRGDRLGARRIELAHTQVLRLGRPQSRGPDAGADGRCSGERDGGRSSRAHGRTDHHRLRPARPFRALPQALHERLGPPVPERDAARAGSALPCRADDPGLSFWNVRDRSLAEIWRDSPAFNAFRGTDWMREPCRSCERREIDFGGCRCQAMALTGDPRNTDPVCVLSPLHDRVEHLTTAPRVDAYVMRERPAKASTR